VADGFRTFRANANAQNHFFTSTIFKKILQYDYVTFITWLRRCAVIWELR
jgi:hypothetical protein